MFNNKISVLQKALMLLILTQKKQRKKKKINPRYWILYFFSGRMSNSHLFLRPDFIKTVSQNGVGRYVCQLQRVVLKFCKNNGSSGGMRDFIESELVHFAKENPGVVVYLKPRRHRTPIIKAEYLNGDVQWVNCRNFSNEDIIKWLTLLKTQQKNTTGIRYRKLWHTDIPSIQGPWTPYTFRESALNLAKFPNKDLGQPADLEPTTSESLSKIFRRQLNISEV